jgi:hypothetical protein
VTGTGYEPPDDPARADLLLGSPRGRLLLAGCLDFAFGNSLYEQLGLGPVPGTARLTRRPAWLTRTEFRRDAGPGPRRWQDVAPQEVRAVVGAAVAQGKWRGLLDLGELELLAVLAGAHPDFDGAAAGDEGTLELIAMAAGELRPVAAALVSAPAARRWWDPVARADQRFLEWDGWPRLTGQAVRWAVRDSVTAARAENARGLEWAARRGEPARGCWWSVPECTVQTMTTGGFGDVSAIALSRFEDLFVPLEDTGATVWSLGVAPQARVMEIAGPADWQALVAAFPQDVTGTHGGEWAEDGGPAGPWRLPDWDRVMEHYDGVHLTVGGYLACGGLTMPAGDGYTMLAGWVPDATIWLRDVATGQRCLGRWYGDPQGTGTWDDLPGAFTATGP